MVEVIGTGPARRVAMVVTRTMSTTGEDLREAIARDGTTTAGARRPRGTTTMVVTAIDLHRPGCEGFRRTRRTHLVATAMTRTRTHRPRVVIVMTRMRMATTARLRVGLRLPAPLAMATMTARLDTGRIWPHRRLFAGHYSWFREPSFDVPWPSYMATNHMARMEEV
jgi:hypothetical protein